MHQGACPVREVRLDTSLRAFLTLPFGVAVWQLRAPGDLRSLRFVGANPAAERELGVSLAFAVGKSIAECFPKLLDTQAPELYRRVALSGQPETLGEFVFRDAHIPEGVFWIDCFPMPDSCVGISMENITERKRVLENQKRALEALNNITAYLNDMPTLFEAAQFCVDEICKQTGWPVGRFFLSDEACASRFSPNCVWHFSDVRRFGAFRKATELFERDLANKLALEYRAMQGQKAGLKRSIGFSVVGGGHLRGVLEFSSETTAPLDENFSRVISNVGLQLGQVFANERALREHDRLQEHIALLNTRRDALPEVVSSGSASLPAFVASVESLKQSCRATALSSRKLAESTRLMQSHLEQMKRLATISARISLKPQPIVCAG
jgi:PAS domain-containing protein